MRNFWIGLVLSPVVFTAMFLFWIVAFDAIDRHMVEYQECGYPCKVSEYDNER